jgi:hypothetical protein
MDKLKVFVGSSKEAKGYAQSIKKILKDVGGVEVKGWWDKDAFKYGLTNIESLLKAVSETDASVFVFSEDVHVTQRGEAAWGPRDNVVFEHGMFVAVQGRENVGLARVGTPTILSDLGGVKYIDLEKIDDKYSFIKRNRKEVRKWIEAVKKNHTLRLQSPVVPPVTRITNEHLKSFGASIVSSTKTAIESLIYLASIPRPEPRYWRFLIEREISGLKSGDALWAICGEKNYDLDVVYRYLNENIALARSGVSVHRLYVAPEGKFKDREWDVIDSHLKWAKWAKKRGKLKKGGSFKVGVLVGKDACAELLELNLPQQFGMVLTRLNDSWKAHIHYPDYPDKDSQVGWVFEDEVIVLKLRTLFEDISRRAERIGITTDVQEAMRRELSKPGFVREKRLWQQGQRRPVL